ncbi:hypothetical protein [Zoogloea sp.]|uniref:hypothetical protein n=1 Tax=Zoogloea sp. TaxID=49181 RepID=UPI0035B0C189
MFKLIRGDYCFSSWSFRVASLLDLAGCQYEDVYLPLDWPMKFSAEDFVFVDLDLSPEDDACFCPCDHELLNRLMRDHGLHRNPLLTIQPHVPVLLDCRNGLVVATYRSILDRIVTSTCEGAELKPEEEGEQCLMWQLVDHFTADYLPLMNHMSFAKSLRGPRSRGHLDLELVRGLAEKFLLTLDTLIGRFCQRKSFPFGKMTCLEITLAPFAQQFMGWGYPGIEGHPCSDYLQEIIEHPAVSSLLKRASEPYYRIERSEENSPAWIAHHYRYWKEYNLIHDWQNMVIHRLENDSAVLIFEEALAGSNVNDIGAALSKRFCISPQVAVDDAVSFLESISPVQNYGALDKSLVGWSKHGR